MKTIAPFIFLLAFGVIASCNKESKNDDEESLKNVLSDYFDGIRDKDENKMNSVTTDDFILFEDGKVWNNDSLLTLRNTFHSFQGTWKFDFIRITVDNSTGSIVYLNQGDFIIDDTIKVKPHWVESATFRKVDGNWKMNLLHSTAKK